MQSIKTSLVVNVFFALFLPLSQVFASSVDEVICSAMKGMVEKETKKIPFNIDEFSIVGISVNCENKTLTTEKKHISLKKAEFKANFQETYQENWKKSNCSNMIFNTDTGWSTVQFVKDGGVLVRAGHTEASVDISKLSKKNTSAVEMIRGTCVSMGIEVKG